MFSHFHIRFTAERNIFLFKNMLYTNKILSIFLQKLNIFCANEKSAELARIHLIDTMTTMSFLIAVHATNTVKNPIFRYYYTRVHRTNTQYFIIKQNTATTTTHTHTQNCFV